MSNQVNEQFVNLSILRAVASLLVVYAHLFVAYAELFISTNIFPASYIQTYITEPLGIIQDFGWFGVVLFFLISGFIITHVTQRESQAEFAVRRLFRIYPPLIVAILIGAFLAWAFNGGSHSPSEYLISFTLFNYWLHPQVITLGVAWTLVIEVTFYAITFLSYKLIRIYPSIAIIVQLLFIFVVTWFCRSGGHGFFLFSVSVSYLPFLIFGQIIYFQYASMINTMTFVILTLSSYLVLFFGLEQTQPIFLGNTNSYLISFLYAYFIFIVLLLLKNQIRLGLITGFFSDISYSLYLYHGIIGVFLMKQLSQSYQSQLIIIPAVIISILMAWLSLRFIEKPSIQLGRFAANTLQKIQKL